MIASLFAAAVLPSAGDLAPASTPAPGLDPARLSAPILDMPDEVEGAYAVPTWIQAIELTKAQYQASHRVMAAWAERRFGPANRDRAAVLIGFAWELIANQLPLGSAWAHEEGHRAVLDHRGIQSFDGIYDLDPTRGAVYVRGVRDRDLERLKAEHPADAARLAAAGMETQTLLGFWIERDLFFLSGRIPTDWPTLVTNALNDIGYLWTCSDPVFDAFTDAANEHDGRVLARRDALGLDCTAWAYDLQRPLEPYAARGVHPSGRGIDRYVKFSDLSYREQRLLRTVRWLSLAALADPFLWFEDGWGTPGRRGSGNLAFYLTSFGWTLDQNLFMAAGSRNLIVTLHQQANGARWMPGADVELWRLPVAIGGRAAWLTLAGGVWLQPEDQRWAQARAVPGGRVGAALAVPVWSALELELAAGYKTAGWVAGNAALEPSLDARAGIAWNL